MKKITLVTGASSGQMPALVDAGLRKDLSLAQRAIQVSRTISQFTRE